MKVKSLLLILAMACSLGASAYVPLVREGVKWVYYWDYDNEPNDGVIYHCEVCFEIIGDSIVDGVSYKKVYRHRLSVPVDVTTDKPYALVREENKVVYIHQNLLEDDILYDEIMMRFGEIPMVKGSVTDEWVLYDFNDINRPFSNIPENDLDGFNCTRPNFTYSGTIEIDDESAKVYTDNSDSSMRLIEGLGYVCLMSMTYDLWGWVVSAADLNGPKPIGYPMYYYEFSYLADNEGNVLYKGPAYAKMCDNNYDRKVDGNDLNRLINFVLNGDKPWESYKYDANGDSAVDGADINEVINFILKR